MKEVVNRMETNFAQEDLVRLKELKEIEEARHRNLLETDSRFRGFMEVPESLQQAVVARSELELTRAQDLCNADMEQRRA